MKQFVAAHPEFVAFAGWAKNAPWTSSYAEERYNGLNSFVFVDGSGAKHPSRWSLIPEAQPVAITPEELAMTPSRTPAGHGPRIGALST
jgi:catalase